MKVLRLESPLYFGNVERFRSALVAAAGLDPSTQQQPRKEVKLANNDSDEKDELLENENGADSNYIGEIPNGVSKKKNKFFLHVLVLVTLLPNLTSMHETLNRLCF